MWVSIGLVVIRSAELVNHGTRSPRPSSFIISVAMTLVLFLAASFALVNGQKIKGLAKVILGSLFIVVIVSAFMVLVLEIAGVSLFYGLLLKEFEVFYLLCLVVMFSGKVDLRYKP